MSSHRSWRNRLHVRRKAEHTEAQITPQGPEPVGGVVVPEPHSVNDYEHVGLAETLQERLWNDAYDSLKDNEAATVEAYEAILTAQLKDGMVPQDRAERRRKLEQVVQAGLERTERDVAVKQRIDTSMDAVKAVRGIVERCVKASPEASVAWAGVCLTMEILANPIDEALAHHKAIGYVLGRLEWHTRLAGLLLDEDLASERSQPLREELSKKVCKLYQKLLLFQMRSVCHDARRRSTVVLRDLLKLDDWNAQLAEIQDAEQALDVDSRHFNAREAISKLDSLHQDSLSFMALLQRQIEYQQDFRRTDEDKECLRALRITDPRVDKARIEEDKGGLLYTAYSWILKHADLLKWQKDPESRVLWVSGDPGKGKTMLLCGVINELQNLNPGMVSFAFCETAQTSDATGILRGLMYQMVIQQPSLLGHLRSAFRDAGSALFEDVNAWASLSNVMVRILQDAASKGSILVVDALDECTTDLPRLLAFISRTSSHVKWLVTSRNRREIQTSIDAIAGSTRLPLEDNEKLVGRAVRLYIRREVGTLAALKGYDASLKDTVKSHLASNAQNTFLWVALVCDMLRESRVTTRSTREKLESVPVGLEHLYAKMLEQIEDCDDSLLCRRVLAVSTVAYRPLTLEELLVLDKSLSDALTTTSELEEIVSHCGSFVAIRNGSVRFVHQSARDFLSEKASASIFTSGLDEEHYALYSRSLELLNTRLERNIHKMAGVGPVRGKIRLSPPSPDPLRSLRYSCLFWAGHFNHSMRQTSRQLEDMPHWNDAFSHFEQVAGPILSAVGLLDTYRRGNDGIKGIVSAFIALILPLIWLLVVLRILRPDETVQQRQEHQQKSSTLGPLHYFLQNRFIHWLEALSLLDSVPVGIIALLKLEECLRNLEVSTTSPLPRLRGVLRDANRFIRHNKDCIEESPLQVYSSALLFSPSNSIIRKLYSHEEPSWVTLKPLVATNWDACLQTIAGSYCTTVRFTRDGRRLVTLGGGVLRIWDAISGAHLRFKRGARSLDLVVAEDGNVLASVTESLEIEVWDIVTGAQLGVVESFAEDDKTEPDCAVLAPMGSMLAVAYSGNIVKLWDPQTRQCLAMLEAHTASVFLSLAFSPDACHLAAATSTGQVVFWDTNTWSCVKEIQTDRELSLSSRLTHDRRILANFTENAEQLAVRASDSLAYVLNTIEGQVALRVDGSIGEFAALALSPDGKKLVSASTRRQINVRETRTGSLLYTLGGHGDDINSLAFAPDSMRLASASADGTVKIWDMTTMSEEEKSSDVSSVAKQKSVVDPPNSIHSMILLKDDEWLLTCSYDGTSRLWSTETGRRFALEDGGRRWNKVWPSPYYISPYSVKDRSWITMDDIPLLWLPPDVRPVKYLAKDEIIALGTGRGSVCIIRFAKDSETGKFRVEY